MRVNSDVTLTDTKIKYSISVSKDIRRILTTWLSETIIGFGSSFLTIFVSEHADIYTFIYSSYYILRAVNYEV